MRDRGQLRVALVGPSGSGKSTAAERLTARKAQMRWIETSNFLVRYSALRKIEARSEQGEKFFFQTGNSEGKDWAAKRILSSLDESGSILVTGLRGIENLRTFQTSGFICIFLSCLPEISIARIVERDGAHIDSARERLFREESAYQLSIMRKASDFVLDTSELPKCEVDRQLSHFYQTAASCII